MLVPGKKQTHVIWTTTNYKMEKRGCDTFKNCYSNSTTKGAHGLNRFPAAYDGVKTFHSANRVTCKSELSYSAWR